MEEFSQAVEASKGETMESNNTQKQLGAAPSRVPLMINIPGGTVPLQRSNETHAPLAPHTGKLGLLRVGMIPPQSLLNGTQFKSLRWQLKN